MRKPSPNFAAAQRTEIQPGIWLDSRLALWLAPERLLVMADLHWGYAASHRARGNLLPWWGDDELEQRLDALIADYGPAEMLWLGDIVHAAEGAARVETFLRRAAPPITVLAGNHDRRWPGARQRTATRGRFFFHHGDDPEAAQRIRTSPPIVGDLPRLEIVGHHHPAVAWSDGAGTHVKLPALVAGPQRLILPAFSPWAAGTPWNHRRETNDLLWAIAPKRIFTVPFPAPSRSIVSS